MKPVSKIEQPVVRHLADFDRNSGWWIERVLFNHRGLVFTFCLIVTVVLGYNASKLRLNASFEKTIPTHYPFIVNYLKHKSDMGEFGNAVRIAIENKKGTIYDASYLDTLEKISDEVFLLEGVDRPFMKSLWTPNTQWFGVTEQGFERRSDYPERLQRLAAKRRAGAAQRGALGRNRPDRCDEPALQHCVCSAAADGRKRQSAGLRQVFQAVWNRSAASTAAMR